MSRGDILHSGDSGRAALATDAASYRVNVDNAMSCDTLSAVFDKFAPTDPRLYVTYVWLLVYFADAQAMTAIFAVYIHLIMHTTIGRRLCSVSFLWTSNYWDGGDDLRAISDCVSGI